MARPEKDKYEQHRRNVMVRLTEEQYELVKINVKRMGIAVAEYGRQQFPAPVKHVPALLKSCRNLICHQR